MNLNKLKTFIHVAQCGSITQTAQELFRTQPAISSALRGLEKETGLILFERRNARIHLTPQGRELYNFCQGRIYEMEDKANSLRENLDELNGIIRIGILNDFCELLASDIIAKFRLRFPKVFFKIMSIPKEDLEPNLLNGELDIALMSRNQQQDLFDTHSFKRFTRELFASPIYLKNSAPINQYEDILGMDLLGSDKRLDSFRHWFRTNGITTLESTIDKITPTITATDIANFNQLVIKGLGIGLCYKELIKDQIEKKELVSLFPNSNPIHITLHMSRRKKRSPSLLMDTFWEFLKEHRDKI